MTVEELKDLHEIFEQISPEHAAAIVRAANLEIALDALKNGLLESDADVEKCVAAQRISRPKTILELAGETVPFKV